MANEGTNRTGTWTIAALVVVEVALCLFAWFAGIPLRSGVPEYGVASPATIANDPSPATMRRFELTCDESMLRMVVQVIDAYEEEQAEPQRRRERVRAEVQETWIDPLDFDAAEDPSLYDLDVLGNNMQALLDACHGDAELLGLECDDDACTAAIQADRFQYPGNCGEPWEAWRTIYGKTGGFGSGSGDCPDGSPAQVAIWATAKPARLLEPEDRGEYDCKELTLEECKGIFEVLHSGVPDDPDGMIAGWNRMAVEYGCGDE